VKKNLFRLVLALVFIGASVSASATTWIGNNGIGYPSAMAACQSKAAALGYAFPGTITFVTSISAKCYSTNNVYFAGVQADYNNCTAGISTNFNYSAPSPVDPLCSAGCAYSATNNICAGGSCNADATSTGDTCGADTNGIGAPPSTTTTAATTTTTTAATTTSTGAATTTTGGSTTTTGTTPTTTAPGGGTGDGSGIGAGNGTGSPGGTDGHPGTGTNTGGGSGTDTMANDCSATGTCQTDLCTQHPDLNVCNNSNISGGCNAGIDSTSCQGDAIQCAILQAERQRYCEDHKDTPQIDLGVQILNGADPLQTTLPTVENGSTVDLSSTSLDSTGWGVSSSCIADVTLTILGHQSVLPFSQICPYLLVLRFAIMLLASLASFRMVSGTILRI
jgi:hypothetical protein